MRPCSQADCHKARDARAFSLEPKAAVCEWRSVIDIQGSDCMELVRSVDFSDPALPRRPKAIAFGMDAASSSGVADRLFLRNNRRTDASRLEPGGSRAVRRAAS